MTPTPARVVTDAPAWSVRLCSEFDAADARASALARPLTAAQLNWTPQPGVWSVGQCLEHLCVASEVYLPAIARSLAQGRAGIVQDIRPGWFGRWFLRTYIEPSSPTTKRARAPGKIRPGSVVDAGVVDRFIANNERTREIIDRAKPYDVNRVRFTNPFVPVIRFTVGTGFEILSKHQDRHLRQAERIRASVAFPAFSRFL
jgi:hypothetical protein